MKNRNTLKNLKQVIYEAIKEASVGRSRMILEPGTPEWEDLQKALNSYNLPKRVEPEEIPVQRSKHPVKIISPEEMDVLRKAAEILHNKGK